MIANETLYYGQIIEQKSCLELSAEEWASIPEGKLRDLCFVDPSTYKGPSEPCKAFMLCGDAARCNHSDEPNAKMIWEKGWGMLVAQKEIFAGEEITLRYTNLLEYEDRETWIAA